MTQIWTLSLRLFAWILETVSQLLRSSAEYIRRMIGELGEVDIAPSHEFEVLPSSELPHFRVQREDILDSPRPCFDSAWPTVTSPVQAEHAPSHWLADVHRIRTQGTSFPKEGQSAASSVGERLMQATTNADGQVTGGTRNPQRDSSSTTEGQSSRQRPMRVIQTIEELPKASVVVARSNDLVNVSNDLSHPVELQSNIVPESVNLAGSKLGLDQSQIPSSSRHIDRKLLRFVQPNTLVSTYQISEAPSTAQSSARSILLLQPTRMLEKGLIAEIANESVQHTFEQDGPRPGSDELRYSPILSDEGPRTNATDNDLPMTDVRLLPLTAAPIKSPTIRSPENSPVETNKLREIWPKLPSNSRRPSADDSLWPALVEQYGSSPIQLDVQIGSRRLRRAARVQRLDQEQRGE